MPRIATRSVISVRSIPALGGTGVADRVETLLGQMSVAEKAGQLTQYFYFNLPPAEDAGAGWGVRGSG